MARNEVIPFIADFGFEILKYVFGEENIRSKNMEEMVTVYLLGKKYSD